jgi:hypothetical protein
LQRLGRTHLALGDPTLALQHADHALALCRTTNVEPLACALAKFVRARALWPDVSRRHEALIEARAAQRELAQIGSAAAPDSEQPDSEQIDAWLAEHRIPT